MSIRARTALVFLLVAGSHADGQTTSWDGTTGNWSDVTKWDNGVPNSNTAIAQLLAGASPFTTTVNGAFTLNQLVLNNANATLLITSGNSLTFGGASPTATLSAGTISNAGTINGGAWTMSNGNLLLNGGSFVGGSIAATGTGRIDATVAGGTLSGVAVSGNVIGVAQSQALLILTNNTSFTSGSQATVSGQFADMRVDQNSLDNLAVTLSGDRSSLQLFGNRTLTLGSGTTVSSSVLSNLGLGNITFGGGNTNGGTTTNVVLNGLVQANSGATFRVNPTGTFTIGAGGILRTNAGGILDLSPTGVWSNSGTIDVNGGRLNLNRAFNASDIGAITRSGGEIHLRTTLTNDVGVDVQGVFKGDLLLDGGTIVGGTLTTSGAGKIDATGSVGTLNGVAASGNIIGAAQSQGLLILTNNTTFTSGSQATVSGQFADMRVDQNSLDNLAVTLSGDRSSLQLFGNRTLTLGSGTTVTSSVLSNLGLGNLPFGGGNTNGGTTTNVVLNGLVQANSGATFRVNPTGTFTIGAGGILQTNSGGILDLSPTGTWSNSGTIDVNGGRLNLNRAFNASDIGTITRSGGEIHLRTTLTNNVGLDVQSVFKGDLLLDGGTIVGGTLTTSGTGKIDATGAVGTLNGVAASGNVIGVVQSQALLVLTNNTTFALGSQANIIGQFSDMRVDQNNLDNLAVTLSGDRSSLQLFGNRTLTLGSGTTVISSVLSNLGLGNLTFGGGNGNGGTTTNLVLDGTAQSNTGGNLRVNPTGALTVGASGVLQASGGTLFIPNATAFTNYSGTTLTGGIYKVSGGGTLNFDTTRNSITNLAAGTTVELNGASTFAAIDQLANNAGTFRLLGGRTFTTVGAFTNSGLLEVSGAGSTFTMAGGAAFTNSNTVNITGGAAFNNGAAATHSAGVFTVATASTVGGAGSLTVQNTAILRDDGTINKNLTIDAGGRLQGIGIVNGNVAADGEIAPGNSAGTLTVNGSISQSGSSITTIEIGGTTAGTQYDRLIVGQTITLGGNLAVALFNGFVPDFQDTFTVIQAGSVLGRWTNTPNDVYFFGSFQMDVQYAPTFVALTHFSPVPEPGALLLAGLGLTGIFASRWRLRSDTQRVYP